MVNVYIVMYMFIIFGWWEVWMLQQPVRKGGRRAVNELGRSIFTFLIEMRQSNSSCSQLLLFYALCCACIHPSKLNYERLYGAFRLLSRLKKEDKKMGRRSKPHHSNNTSKTTPSWSWPWVFTWSGWVCITIRTTCWGGCHRITSTPTALIVIGIIIHPSQAGQVDTDSYNTLLLFCFHHAHKALQATWTWAITSTPMSPVPVASEGRPHLKGRKSSSILLTYPMISW